MIRHSAELDMAKPTDFAIINTNQRKKAILGKVFNMQHELLDTIFKDSCDHRFNNFINLYERSVNWSDQENLLFEVKSDFKETIYFQWNHGQKTEGLNAGMKFPGYISYMKSPTKDGPFKLVDIDIKNLNNFIGAPIMEEYENLVKNLEESNLNARMMSSKDVDRLHSVVMELSEKVKDEMSKYSWVGGVFWGGKGFSYWGDWEEGLMDNMARAGLIDELTNTGQHGYHAQRISSVQFFKPTLVTNYLCDGDFSKFRFCSPAFFMLKGNDLDMLLEKYYKFNFISTFKSTVPFETQLKWQDSEDYDLKLWDAWREELKRMEDDIRTVVFMNEPRRKVEKDT
jgi:hypothetical protein